MKAELSSIDFNNFKLESNGNNDEDNINYDSAQALATNTKHGLIIDILRVVVCRVAAIFIYCYCIGFMICAVQFSYKYSFLVFLLPIFVIIMDTIWICIKRKGKEYDWYLKIFNNITLCVYFIGLYKKKLI